MRTNISSGRPWESLVGYSRAVRVGNTVVTAGTAPVGDDGRVLGKDDPYAQTMHCLRTIESALKKAGAALTDVVQTRIYVTDISQWQEIGRAHGEVFKEIRPATTMVEIRRLIDADMLVEIEAMAIVDTEAGGGGL